MKLNQAKSDTLIPETAAEALRRWDTGESVFTVEMGGLGPGYEQCIHITAFEIIRELLQRTLPDWDNEDKVRSFAEVVEKAVLPKIRDLGLSGAQWGAARNLAYRMVRVGWAKGLSEVEQDRHIQVQKEFPMPPDEPEEAA